MKVEKRIFFWIGLIVAFLLLATYFVKIKIDAGSNFIVRDSLLGILIFHNAFVLLIYALVIAFLVLFGLGKIKII